jgi:signal transduction histidine kinase
MKPSNAILGRGKSTGERAAPSRGVLPGTALGLRLLALAVVAAAGALLPLAPHARMPLVVGILAGTFLAWVQYATMRRGRGVPKSLLVLGQVGVWTYLIRASGGPGSPLFVGYLLEIPLAGILLSRRGVVGAAVAAATFYLILCWKSGPLDLANVATATGFLAVTAAVAWLLVEVLERQEREVAASHAVLSARAENLAEEMRLLGDYLEDALVGLDELGRVASANRAAVDLLGGNRSAIVGKAWQEVLAPDAAGSQAILAALLDGVPRRHFALLLARDRAPMSLETEIWTSASPAGRRTWLLMTDRAREGVETDPLRKLGEAVACVSHQIRNSLHALQGYTRTIGLELENQGRNAETTGDLLHALEGLGELAEDVLARSGAPRHNDDPVALTEAIASAVKLARRPEVSIEVVRPEREVWVRSGRGELIHALFNLIDNACSVSPPGEPVSVQLDVRDGEAGVEINDRGPGLPRGLDRIEGRAPSRKGSGYGLLAARRFLERDGGHIHFEPGPRGGTRCRVILPLAPTPTTAP